MHKYAQSGGHGSAGLTISDSLTKRSPSVFSFPDFSDDACDSLRSRVTWASEAGATYFIQVTGYSQVEFGDYTLSVSGVTEPPVEVDGTYPVLLGPLAFRVLLNLALTSTSFSAGGPACCSTAYFAYDPKTDEETQRFYNGSVVCIDQPYNIQVDLCDAPADALVRLKLADANCRIIHRQNEMEFPYFLWGNKGEDVFRNHKPLPNGGYYLYSKEDGDTERIQFTQSCPGQGPGNLFGKVCGTKF